MKSNKLNVIRIIIGFFILFLFVYKVGIKSLIEAIAKINPVWVIPVIVLYLLGLLIGAFNIWILLLSFNKKITLPELFWPTVNSWAVGMIMPGKVGEFSIIYFLKEHDISLGDSAAIATIDKMITLISLVLVSAFGFFIFFDMFTAIKTLILIVLLSIILLAIILSEFGRGLIKKFILRKYHTNFKGFSNRIFWLFKNAKVTVLLNFLITVLKWGISALTILLLFEAFHIHVPFIYIFVISCTTTVISLIPITMSGVGIKESASASLYSLIGVDVTIAMGVQIVMLALSYTITLIIVAITSIKKK